MTQEDVTFKSMEDYIEVLHKLLSHSENEVVEFKRAEKNFDSDELGKYFSALSNEANLRDYDFAWLVFGIDNNTHTIAGTSYRNSEDSLNKLKHEVSIHTSDSLTFRETVSLIVDGKRVLMFKIPATPRNIVMRWKGVAYGRDGESLKPLNQAKMDEIREQSPIPDWTAQLVPSATLQDLDKLALATAIVMFKKVHAPKISEEEIDSWPVEEFLARSDMMRDGYLTRAAILLLGKPEALSKLHPAVAQITWTMQDKDGIVEDYCSSGLYYAGTHNFCRRS